MSNKNLLAVIGIIIVIVIVVGVIYWSSQRQAGTGGEGVGAEQQAVEELSKTIGESAAVPTLDIGGNPLENLPDTNPVTKTNPFKDIKTNPFE